MASMRNWCSALFLVPLGLLTSHASHAGEPTAATLAAHGTLTASATPLPYGIHQKKNGRFIQDLCDHHKKHYCMGHRLLPKGWTPDKPIPPRTRKGNGGGNSEGMGPSDVLSAYNIPSSVVSGGKIVAVLDGPDSNALTDLNAYRNQYGLGALSPCSGNPPTSGPACFAQVNETGGASSGEDSGEDSDAETSLDMDMVSAACPDCTILLVEIGNSQGDIEDDDFVDGAETAKMLGASAISISIGGGEEGNDPTGNYTEAGHLVLSASGDYGYDLVNESSQEGGGSGPSYPASAPDVVAVGGTTLFNSGSSYAEAVWNDGTFNTSQNGQDVTTSGCSQEYAAPSWQSSALSGTSCSKRATADVAAAAAFYSGGEEVDIAVYQGGWQSVEGTSASSPMVAGILTRLGLTDAISANIGWIYSNASAWNDLGSTGYPVDSSGSDTDSNDPSSCGALCTAGPGWDGPSGMGTPNGVNLATAAGMTISPPGSGSGTSADDAGGGTTSGSDAGSGTTGGSGTGTGGGGTSPQPGQLGASCDGPSFCDSMLCAEQSAGSPQVCTQTCLALGDATPGCPAGFACDDGYCFASSGLLLNLPDAGVLNLTVPGADGGTGDADTGSSGGCAVSARDDAGASEGLLLLPFGVVLVIRRRRSRKG